MESITLYVDSFNGDKTYGMTQDVVKVKLNMKKLNDYLIESFTEHLLDNKETTHVGIAGRFIYSLSINVEIRKYYMIFWDCKNDVVIAAKEASRLPTPDLRGKFMKQFDLLKSVYQKNYSDVLLSSDKPTVG